MKHRDGAQVRAQARAGQGVRSWPRPRQDARAPSLLLRHALKPLAERGRDGHALARRMLCVAAAQLATVRHLVEAFDRRRSFRDILEALAANSRGLPARLYREMLDVGDPMNTVEGACAWARHWEITSDAVAFGEYVDSSLTVSNMGQLRINTSSKFSDEHQLFAAGFLEAYLSAERIHDYFSNTYEYFTSPTGMNASQSLGEALRWLEDQDRWARDQVEAHADSSTYWRMLGLVLRQFDGIVAGYEARRADEPSSLPALTRRDLMFLNGNGELYDLLEAPAEFLSGQQQQGQQQQLRGSGPPEGRTPRQVYHDVALKGRCSALVAVTPDFSDILLGHSTWDSYSQMTKVFKHYSFQLQSVPNLAAQRMSFSSYPGELFSDDDLYMMDSGLAVLSTTNHFSNSSAYSVLTPQSLVSWQRVRVANALATSGEEWVAQLDFYNSGTYNNQYMVLDLKRFTPGRDLPPGLLWVAEQIPGLIAAEDLTRTLARGYWPSYNIPYFPEVYNRSGLLPLRQALAELGPDYSNAIAWLSYQLTPRASIFRRDAASVTDLAAMQRLMRSNAYVTDKLSNGDPIAAVCGRGDLDPHMPDARGCFDSKVTSFGLATRLEALAITGPTTQGGLPPFEWSKQFASVPHAGMPAIFDFGWEHQTPAFPFASASAAA